jgi:NAD(P)H-flavin reductase
MSQWYDARISSSRPAAHGLVSLWLDVSQTPLKNAHVAAGQYVKLSLDGHKEGFFALASPPHRKDAPIELLIKTGSTLADALAALPEGATVRISDVQGKGFPLEKAKGKRVMLFATGSGISPVRSLIEALIQNRDEYGPVSLYFGARTPESFAYASELSRWAKEDIHIVQTVSRPGTSGWEGLTGYVQSHIPNEPLSDAVAFLCGQKDMVQGVTSALLAQGLPKENIFLNF